MTPLEQFQFKFASSPHISASGPASTNQLHEHMARDRALSDKVGNFIVKKIFNLFGIDL